MYIFTHGWDSIRSHSLQGGNNSLNSSGGLPQHAIIVDLFLQWSVEVEVRVSTSQHFNRTVIYKGID